MTFSTQTGSETVMKLNIKLHWKQAGSNKDTLQLSEMVAEASPRRADMASHWGEKAEVITLHWDVHYCRRLQGQLLMRQPFLSGTSDSLSMGQIRDRREGSRHRTEEKMDTIMCGWGSCLTQVTTDRLSTNEEGNNKPKKMPFQFMEHICLTLKRAELL